MTTDYKAHSATEDAIEYLQQAVERNGAPAEREIARRQLSLLIRARHQDPVMAEKIAETFGFHSHEGGRKAG